MAEQATRTVAVTIRYFASARAAAGVTEEVVAVEAAREIDGKPEATTTVGAVIAVVTGRHGTDLARVLPRCSYLLDEVAVHGPATLVRDGQVIDVLPPFAGG